MFDLEFEINKVYNLYIAEIKAEEERIELNKKAQINERIEQFRSELSNVISLEYQQAIGIQIYRPKDVNEALHAFFEYRGVDFKINSHANKWGLHRDGYVWAYMSSDELLSNLLIQLGDVRSREV